MNESMHSRAIDTLESFYLSKRIYYGFYSLKCISMNYLFNRSHKPMEYSISSHSRPIECSPGLIVKPLAPYRNANHSLEQRYRSNSQSNIYTVLIQLKALEEWASISFDGLIISWAVGSWLLAGLTNDSQQTKEDEVNPKLRETDKLKMPESFKYFNNPFLFT